MTKKEIAAQVWLKLLTDDMLKYEDNSDIYLYYPNNNYAEILIKQDIKKFYVKYNFWSEYQNFFNLNYKESNDIICRWINNNFDTVGFTTNPAYFWKEEILKLPEK